MSGFENCLEGSFGTKCSSQANVIDWLQGLYHYAEISALAVHLFSDTVRSTDSHL